MKDPKKNVVHLIWWKATLKGDHEVTSNGERARELLSRSAIELTISVAWTLIGFRIHPLYWIYVRRRGRVERKRDRIER